MITGGSSFSGAGSGAIWTGSTKIKGSSEAMRMALLTCSLVGIQFTWGIEMTYCTPYLLKLGLTKSKVSLVWLAGPLSGLIMQPVVGIVADKSKSRWGRRRPYMAIGSIVVTICLLILGWTAEVIDFLFSGSSQESRRELTTILAVLSIYGVDFAINAVQASTRSLIVDSLASNKQQAGSAWASRMVAIGHLIGYGAGAMDLTKTFGNAMGDTQFKQLIVISASALLLCVGITCWAVSERILVSDGSVKMGEEAEKPGVGAMMSQIVRTARNLPPRISAICWITFWCWIGWFPFLFYSTTWIGEVYLRHNAPAEAKDHPDSLGQMGRVGSMALIAFSSVHFVSSILLPWFVESPEDAAGEFTPRPPKHIAGALLELQKWKPSLHDAWTYSILLFAAAMVCAPFISSMRAATTLVAVCGIPWAVQCWAPFTFLGVEINILSTHPPKTLTMPKSRASGDFSTYQKEALYGDIEKEIESSLASMAATTKTPLPETNAGNLSGIYLGILNLYTTLPQFIGTFISWAVFSVLEPGKSPELAKHAHPDEHHSTDGPNAIAVCLFVGALAAIMAARETRRLIL